MAGIGWLVNVHVFLFPFLTVSPKTTQTDWTMGYIPNGFGLSGLWIYKWKYKVTICQWDSLWQRYFVGPNFNVLPCRFVTKVGNVKKNTEVL